MPIPLKIELDLDLDGPPVVAFGADGKSGLCVAGSGRATLLVLGDDLADPATRESFRDEANRLIGNAAIPPRYAAHDLHPDFFASRIAIVSGLIPIPVQHHHAHMAAVIAERRIDGPSIGVTFDGMGLGDDGGLWGGEFLAGDLAGFERVGHLGPVAQPGGDAAAREPWRMALSLLRSALGEKWEKPAAGILERQGRSRCETLVRALDRGINAPATSSAGRLFEGAAAILGLGDVNTSPAQVAIACEKAATGQAPAPMAFEVRRDDGRWSADPAPVIRALARATEAGEAPGPWAAGFHLALAEAVAAVCDRIRRERELDTVVLSGGVFMNRLLREWSREKLVDLGFKVFMGEAAPPHDGSLALGQAAAAMARVKERKV